MKKVISRGFTLIELLVVIAIIGILASIVLVSLNSARSKGKDARLISDVNQVRTQIEAEASTGGTYQANSNSCVQTNPAAVGGVATINTTATNNCAQLKTDAANTTSGATLTVNTDTAAPTPTFGAYAVAVPLSSGSYYCVDSTGVAETKTAPTTSKCP